MRNTLFSIRLIVAATLSVVSLSPCLARPISELSKGAPKYMGTSLPESSYVEVTTRRLARAKVVWVNFELLHEMGIDIPPEGMTPEFEEQILEAFAWSVPNESDSPENFLMESKTFYADRYGGVGLGRNWGSGRAASAGEIQIKGIGITSLVGDGQTFHHAHGGASMEELIREADWGEVNHRELPWGANRIVVIIDSGTDTVWEDGSRERRALGVRVDPERPAWFAQARSGVGSLRATDRDRTRAAIDRIDQSLPFDPEASTLADRVSSGFMNYTDRIADQYAAAYARGLYHGATSISNFEINGRYIDYGTQTAQAGFAPIKVLDHVAAFGDSEAVEDVLIGEFRTAVMRDAPSDIGRAVPSERSMRSRFEKRYADSLSKEILYLTGAPPGAVDQLASQSSATKLASLIRSLATQGMPNSVNVDKRTPDVIGTYDLREILTRAASVDTSELAIRVAVKDLITNAGVLDRFVQAYLSFVGDVGSVVSRDGVTKAALKTYMYEASAIRNRKQTELYRDEMQSRNVAIVEEYARTGDRSTIWHEIDRNVSAGSRTYRDTAPYELVLKESPNYVQDTSSRLVFNAAKNRKELVYKIHLENASGKFYGNSISADDLGSSALRFTSDNWASSQDVVAKVSDVGDAVEFRIPIDPTQTSIEYALHNADHSRWWKNGDANVRVNIPVTVSDGGNNACVLSLTADWGD